MIDEGAVIARLTQLKQERQSLFEQMAKLEPKIVAYDGAIEDCEYWLAQIRAGQNDPPDEAGDGA